jgi:nucleoside transporter
LLARLSAMMFGQYFAIGVWSVTVGAYISANTSPAGSAMFGSWFMGVAAVSGALGALISPLVFGSLADGMFSTQKLLAVLNLGCAATLIVIAQSTHQTWFFVGLLAYYQFAVPTITLTNSLALRHSRTDGRAFPIARAIGTIGWIAALLLVGSLVPALIGRESIEQTTIPMWLGLASHVGMAGYCLTLPHTPPLVAMVKWRSMIGSWTTLLRDEPRLGRFLLVALVATIGPQFYNAFLNVFVNQIGVSHAASWMSVGQCTEVMVILLLPGLIAAVGPKRICFFGLIIWCVRYVLLLFAGSEGFEFVLTMVAIALHGFCYACFYLTGYMYVDKIAPRKSGAVAQGMFAMATSGVGHMIGSLLAGWNQAQHLTPSGVDPAPYDWPSFWLLPLYLGIAATVLFWATMGLKREIY